MQMQKRAATLTVTALLLITNGCGYFLYPERVGQTQGRIDPAVVALDAAGLLFGIIPGIIAFAVDISTGTIYLPEGEESVVEKHRERVSLKFGGKPLALSAASEIPVEQNEIADELSRKLGMSLDEQQIRYYRITEAQQILSLRAL